MCIASYRVKVISFRCVTKSDIRVRCSDRLTSRGHKVSSLAYDEIVQISSVTLLILSFHTTTLLFLYYEPWSHKKRPNRQPQKCSPLILCVLDWGTSDVCRPVTINPLNPQLNPICYLLALLGAHHFLHVSRIRVKSLTFRLLMSYIYGAPILDDSRSHTTTQHSR